MTEHNHNNEQNSQEPAGKTTRTFTEELEIAGDQLVQKVRELIQAGNVRRVIVRSPEGRVYMEIPLTVGALVGGALLFFTPVLSALGAIGAAIARVRIEIVREVAEGNVSEVNIDSGAIADDVKSAVESAAGAARKAIEGIQSTVSEKAKQAESAAQEAGEQAEAVVDDVEVKVEKAVDDAEDAIDDASRPNA